MNPQPTCVSTTWTVFETMQRSTAVPSAAMKGVLVSRHVNHVWSPSIAMSIVRRIIGQNIKKNVKYEQPMFKGGDGNMVSVLASWQR